MPLPEEVRREIESEVGETYANNSALDDLNSVGALAKSYVETKKMAGNSLGRMPSDDAGPEAMQNWVDSVIEKTNGAVILKPDFTQETQRTEFYRTIGAPEAADKYEIPEDSGLPEATLKELTELGFKHHLTNTQMKGFVDDMANMQKTTVENLSKSHEDDIKALKDEWGMVTEERIDAAKKVLEENPDGRIFENLTTSEVKALYKVHESLTGVGAQVSSQRQSNPNSGYTPEEAMAHYQAVLKRVSNNDENLNHDERIKLTKAAMKVAVEYGGLSGDINELRAGQL